MSGTTTRTLARAARVHRSGRLLVDALLVAAALGTPVLARFAYAESEDWRLVSLERAVRGGYWQEDPLGYLFQHTDWGTRVDGGREWLEDPFTLVVGLLVMALFCRWLLRVVLVGIESSVAGSRIAAQAGELRLTPDPAWSRSLLVGMAPRLQVVAGPLADRRRSYAQVADGRVLLAVRAPGPVPPVLFEAASGRGASPWRRLRLHERDAIVLEGSFLARWRTWTPRRHFVAMPQLLSPAVLQRVAELEGAQYVEAAGDVVAALVPARDVRDARAIDALLDGLEELARELAERFEDAILPDRAAIAATPIAARRARTLQLGRLAIPGHLSLVALVAITAYDLWLVLGTDGGIRQNTLTFHVVLVLWLLLARMSAPRTRRLARGEP